MFGLVIYGNVYCVGVHYEDSHLVQHAPYFSLSAGFSEWQKLEIMCLMMMMMTHCENIQHSFIYSDFMIDGKPRLFKRLNFVPV